MGLFYRESGRGEPVVLLHGLYGCSDNWMYIARRLAEQFRVITVDLRNHGASPHSPVHTYDEMVTDLAWLFSELEIERAHLAGHSMGGKVAMAFAADYPEKILSLTVIDIAPKNYLEAPSDSSQYAMHQTILRTLSSIDLTQFNSRKEVEAVVGQAIGDPFVTSFILKNLKRTGNHFEWKINVPALQNALPHIIGGVDASFFAARMPLLAYPVLFVKGGKSNYIQANDWPAIKQIYPEATLETIDGATHYIQSEKPDELIAIYRHFIQGI